MPHLFQVFGNIFISKTNNKTPVLRPKLHSWNFGSLSPGMTTRSTPASVITTRLATPPLTLSRPMAKARAASTERWGKWRTRRKFRKKKTENEQRGDGSASGGQRFGFVYTLMMDFLHHNCKHLKYYCTLTCWQRCWLILLRYRIKTEPNMGAVGVRWLASQTGSGWKALTVSAACPAWYIRAHGDAIFSFLSIDIFFLISLCVLLHEEKFLLLYNLCL